MMQPFILSKSCFAPLSCFHSASSIIDILTFCHLVFSMWLVAHFSESVPGLSGKSAVFTILQKQKNIREHIFQAN
ncbi:hypothetical protein DXA67_04680 [Bacteroides fragilis]|uniref:Uncharacterized protein n=1 Tax=Bacteroides fragilis TaxID=817 RepID=A0A4P8MP46_BACFG|nr:hypothetical protein EC80_016780 [Bacteroides fragilis]QCQ50518.1 hypothetical protein EE52_014465 [Bacteroides fragilis]QLK83762.1 hypothetical protein DBK98_017240 [Bacteroides sp. PHL 2737]RGX89415.1 hypothetical protein DXA67_04680 [Bacteroides fragilis]